ncbi:hypothetical protein BGX27_003375 [Mortierella sp. AM989]|nr:hypothetical protein BGX27_003375 [Mortierella sp. AM989]
MSPPQSTQKDMLTITEPTAYPSPSLSPATTYQSSMQLSPSPTSYTRHRPSVKALLSSSNPPASPLDALVMALEATVEEEDGGLNYPIEQGEVTEDDDPDATIPSSPTMFMKRPSGESSLHHLPTMMLPESVASSSTKALSSGLTPSTLPNGAASTRASQRKMSISSQDSSSSSNNSNSERTKEYACTIGSCEKKFYQVAHLRSHERGKAEDSSTTPRSPIADISLSKRSYQPQW